MKSKIVRTGPPRTFALVFDKNDDFMDELRRFAEAREVAAGHFTGIGAFQEATIAFFVRGKSDYEEIPVREQVEVLSLTGNIAAFENASKFHVHTVLGRRDGSTLGGHLIEGTIWPTLEVFLTETESDLTRETDEETGLALL